MTVARGQAELAAGPRGWLREIRAGFATSSLRPKSRDAKGVIPIANVLVTALSRPEPGDPMSAKLVTHPSIRMSAALGQRPESLVGGRGVGHRFGPMALERITVDPARMGGLSTVRHTRVTVGMVLGQLASGRTIDEVLADYPYLDREDVLASLEYAAATVNGREVPVDRPR